MLSKREKRPTETMGEASTTLALLRDNLTKSVFDILAAPGGLDVEVGELIINDPTVSGEIEPGDLLLAVGTAIDSGDAIKLIKLAGVRGAAGIVFKVFDKAPSDVLGAAESAGVAVIGVPLELEWGRFHSLLHTAIGSSRPALDHHASSVPVGDLFALANALAASAGGAVAIADPQFRLLAYSSLDQPIDQTRIQTIVGRRAIGTWVKRAGADGTLQQLWKTKDVVYVQSYTDEGLRRRLAIAIRAGDEILGSIWVTEGSAVFGPPAEEALREAASVAALHVIRHLATENLQRRMRGQLVESVLEGREPPELLASRLGIDPNAPLTVIAFELQSTEEADFALKEEALLDLVTLHCQAFRRGSVCVSLGRVVYAVVSTREPVNRNRVVGLAEGIAKKAKTGLRVVLHVGVGSNVPGVSDAPRSRREADEVLRVLVKDDKRRQVAHIEDVRAKVILLQLMDFAFETGLEFDKLRVLAEHDAEHGTPYLSTLRAFLSAFGDMPKAAAELSVHPNTLRYRLSRLAYVSGLNLEDPDERLIAEFGLRQIR